MPTAYTDLSLGAQTSYAELLDMARAVASVKLAALQGSFHRRQIRGKTYVYFNFRDVDGRGRSAYVGPESPRVTLLIDEFKASRAPAREEALSQRAQACIALGCAGMPERDFRTIQKLAGYGFFRAGGVLFGPHAVAAMGNMLGVKWLGATRLAAGDIAAVGQDMAIGFPADLEVRAHDAITSLEMGLMPVREFAGFKGSRRAASGHAVQIGFLTPGAGRGVAAEMPGLGLPMQPSKFLELLVEDTAQGVVFGKFGACIVNLPDPARLAIHRAMVWAMRPTVERAKDVVELEQAAALIEWHVEQDRVEHLRQAWQDALNRGPDWRRHFDKGAAALSKRYPPLAAVFR